MKYKTIMNRPLIKLTIEKFEYLRDWYILRRVEHDGIEWNEVRQVPLYRNDPAHTYTVSYYCNSSRLEKTTDVEGVAYEWAAIAIAIRARKNQEFKRCGVKFVPTGAKLYSPRNSHIFPIVSFESVDYLADQIEKVLNAKTDSE